MTVKLHRCRLGWLRAGTHPCWRVQSALDAAGVDYQVVPGPVRRGKRDELVRLSGQAHYPVIEFEDGTIYREESSAMAERIRAGKLREPDAGLPAPSGDGRDGGVEAGADGQPAS
jgi:Glutathione S-transferase, N-terminal domain